MHRFDMDSSLSNDAKNQHRIYRYPGEGRGKERAQGGQRGMPK